MSDDQTQDQTKEESEETAKPSESGITEVKSDADSQLSEAGEVSSESTSPDVHEPDRAGSPTGEAESEDQDQTSEGKKSNEPTEAKEEPKKAPKPVSASLEKIIESIEKLSVLELADLVKALEDRFGVSAAPVAVATTGGTLTGAAEPTEEQTTFNVILVSSGANKIGAIKAVRELIPTLGLKEAKDLVEAAPKPVLEGVNKQIAEEAKQKLTEAGATAELQ